MHPPAIRSRFAFALLGLLALALVAAACGGDDDRPPPDAAAVPSGDADAQTDVGGVSVGEPAAGGEGRAARDGDTVGVRYHGTLDDGEVFDSNRAAGEPFRFTLGEGQVIAGFDRAVQGLHLGETITVRIPPPQAYGEVDEALMIELPREQAPPGIMAGQQVQLSNGAVVTITEVTDEVVRIDANHRLAGQALTFEIELVELR